MRISKSTRRGFTRIELLVVVICLTLLVAIVIPLISGQRETQRTVACRDRMGSLGQAFLRYADERNGRFPDLEDGEIPWTVSLLPYLNSEEGQQLLDQISRLPSFDSEPLHASRYLCPSGREYAVGANSYVVNGGMGDFEVDEASLDVSEPRPHSLEIDWNGDGSIDSNDLKLSHSSGVIWRPHELIGPWTKSEISSLDGLQQTMLLSENQNARRWQSRDTFDLAFVVGRDRITFGADQHPFDFQASELGPYRINFSRSGRAGRCPSPGSTHGNAVNVVFADGSAKLMSDEIDTLLYLRMMTPGGTKYGEARFM
ncbi:MAG TPA: DUF1559 domain-containing protein, partial [Planctomycetaceae bacterium]|nr:DUF1559 domain-containing protein [Planctomycetaceae bacterium]